VKTVDDLLDADTRRIAEARLAHAIFPDHCLPEPDDEAAWEALAVRAEQEVAAQGIDLHAIGERAEAAALRRIMEQDDA
jgi:hypothetical protein